MDNETRLKAQGEMLTAVSKAERQINEKAKALANQGRAKALKMTDIVRCFNACNEYAEQCEQTHTPLTHAGFMLACNIKSKDTWAKMRRGEYDHLTYKYLIANNIPLDVLDTDADIVEYTDDNGQIHTIPLYSFADLIKKCDLFIQRQLEETCYNPKAHNVAGSIFGLKARFDWDDSNGQQGNGGTVNNLIIADKEQALKCLEMLK